MSASISIRAISASIWVSMAKQRSVIVEARKRVYMTPPADPPPPPGGSTLVDNNIATLIDENGAELVQD